MVTFLLWLGCINIVYYKSSEFGETLIGQYRAKLKDMVAYKISFNIMLLNRVEGVETIRKE